MRMIVIFFLLMATSVHSKVCSKGPLFTGQVIAVVHFPEHCQIFIQFSRYQTQANRKDECKIRDDIAGYFGVFAEMSDQKSNSSALLNSNNEELYQDSDQEGLRKITNPCQLAVRSTVFGLLGRNQYRQITFSKLQVL